MMKRQLGLGGGKERVLGGLCLLEVKGPAGQICLGMSTPFQPP